MCISGRLCVLVLVSVALGSAVVSFAKSTEREPGAAQPEPQPVSSTPPNRHLGGLLAYDVRDADTHAPIPCKLTFVGVEGTPRPAFTHNDIGRPEGEVAISAFDRVFSAVGSEDVRAPQVRNLGSTEAAKPRCPRGATRAHSRSYVTEEQRRGPLRIGCRIRQDL
jgi:hypothetical protein